MSEQRFTIQKASGMYLHLPIFDNGIEMADGDVCILLNEQQATINELKEENDKLIQKNCIPCELVNLQTREIDKLKEENEQLRKQVAECKMILRQHEFAKQEGFE